ncbi:hypothetical protein HHK36_005100 [Tetracentron sinense]|uniref:DJ-1/PfpI domain-containing protein n=1 Tax=Tetracentron sinense TaxID=13715 RepID=A0A834ZPR5_TETSI|nr:hypothetical protein HHK36_005100 [Tetracentron sinense]
MIQIILFSLQVIGSKFDVPFPVIVFGEFQIFGFALLQILVPVANGTEEMEAVMIIDILRRASANVVVASVEDKLQIVASRKVKLVADMPLDEAAKLSYDLIVLPVNWVCHELLPTDLLNNWGKKATAFPALCSKLSDQSEAENRVVVDGNLISSRGPGTSIEFSLAIVEKLFDRKKALEIAKAMVFTHP